MALNIHFYATALLWVIHFEKRKSYLLIIQLLFSWQIVPQYRKPMILTIFVYFLYSILDIFVAKRVSFYDVYLMYKSNNKLLKIQKCFLYFLVYSTFRLLLSLFRLNVYSIGSVLPKTSPKSVVLWILRPAAIRCSCLHYKTHSSGMQIQKQVSPGSCVYINAVVMSRNLHNCLHLPHYQKWITPVLSHSESLSISSSAVSI